jgi:hypothetical protein
MMKVWWLTVPHVRSSSLCFWVFLRDEGTKMMMSVLSGNWCFGFFFFYRDEVVGLICVSPLPFSPSLCNPCFFSLSWFCFSVSSSCFSRLSSSVFFLPSQFSSFSICLYFFSLCPLVLFVPGVLLYCWSWQTMVEEGPLLLLAHGALQRRSFDGGITCGQGRTGSWCKGEDAWWWITPFRCHGLRLGYCSWKNTPLLLVDDLLLLLDYAG